MRLSHEAIKEFQHLWKQEYGKELSYEMAKEYAERFFGLFELVMIEQHNV